MNSLALDQSLVHSQTDATIAFIYFANFKKAEKAQIKFFNLLAAKTKAAAMNGRIKGQERILNRKNKNYHPKRKLCTTFVVLLLNFLVAAAAAAAAAAANGEINQSGSQINRKKERKKTPARANI